MVIILIIQTVLLFLVTSITASLFVKSFSIILSLVLGFIPFLYKNKLEKKQILKINIISSVIVAVLILLSYFIFLVTLQNSLSRASTEVESYGNVASIISLININSVLLNSILFLVLFNIPFLVYFFLNNRKQQEDVD